MRKSFVLMCSELLIVTTMDLLISKSFSWPLMSLPQALPSRNSIGPSECMMWMVSVPRKCCGSSYLLIRQWYNWARGDVPHSSLHLLHDGTRQCGDREDPGDPAAESWQYLQEDGHQWWREGGEKGVCTMLPWRQETHKLTDTPDTQLKGINCSFVFVL